jgi:rRNA processing protein Krr1/Pno1
MSLLSKNKRQIKVLMLNAFKGEMIQFLRRRRRRRRRRRS